MPGGRFWCSRAPHVFNGAVTIHTAISHLGGVWIMSNQAVIIQGTIGPDGTLAVVDKVPLPAGRVRVIVEPLPESQERGRTLPEILEQVRKDQAARGFSGRSRAEIDAELAALAAED